MSGSGGKDCVDAIWHQLKQQESKTKDKTRLESLWKHVQSGSLSSKASIKPATLKQLVPQQQQQGSNIRAGADYSQAACDALCSKLQNGSAVSQLTSALQSLDVRAVKAALQQLQVCAHSFLPKLVLSQSSHFLRLSCGFLTLPGGCGQSCISMDLSHFQAVQGLAALL
jgi:hypothetical protein